jgi:hypothetical protein
VGLTINNPRSDEANEPTSRYRLLEGVLIMEINITNELLNDAVKMQADKQAFVDMIIDMNKTISYQAASDVYWYLKITELKNELDDLRETLLPQLS